VQRVLDDYTTAPIDEKLRATLGLLKKMTLDHGNLGPEDVRAVLRTGVSKQAIQDALEVAFLFNIYDRLADSMGWDVPALEGGYYKTVAKRLLTQGYAPDLQTPTRQ
jgi:alkylhydroperoxidase family enzyme